MRCFRYLTPLILEGSLIYTWSASLVDKSRFIIPPFYFQLIHLSTNNRCARFAADSVTHMGTVRLAARVPGPYAHRCKYQSVHLNDLKESYWLPIQRHKSTSRHSPFFLGVEGALFSCSLSGAQTHTIIHTHGPENVAINLTVRVFTGWGDADEVTLWLLVTW